ncbi:sensor histidine kinase [Mameliella alba]|nr:sensor histidine kinase [Antarctobacter heliothermus]MBY6144613.1 sensor histidine kinase [Mameliella alba]MCA0956131.1 sensor histidine kinase [Mameliella alba]
MTERTPSLRLRLFALIVTPLLFVAVLLGIWRYQVAQATAEELFDRGLLSAALAISRDVAISEGDALSPRTRKLISEAGGGEVFYHVTGPGGVYVTGYAYPPVGQFDNLPGVPEYRVADYRGEAVRLLRMSETTTIGNLTGQSVVTVWQRVSDRHAFASELARRAMLLIAGLIVALAIVVWFGVDWGLRPLLDLQDAIEQRTPDDLARIRRAVPVEARGIVSTLNRLLGQVEASIQSHQAFISDAAHQLRNPASAILSLAESLPGVSDPDERRRREAELIGAARKSAHLAQQLLSLERLRHGYSVPETEFDVVAMSETTCAELAPRVLAQDVDFSYSGAPLPLLVRGDEVLLAEALGNLVDNALRHGGSGLSRIAVEVVAAEPGVRITVSDDGKGLPPDKAALAFSRFGQLQPGNGSGLGLAIVDQVARLHGGEVRIEEAGEGARISLRLPLATSH